MTANPSFQTAKSNLHDFRYAEVALPSLADGHVRVKLSKFALTANNITYGAMGESFGYWGFYPVDDAWGRIPVWGFADVTESRCEGINPGTRIYGFFPMQAEFDLEPAGITKSGFSDGAAHRQKLHPLYNGYVFTAADPGYSKDLEAYQALFRPLFTTSFLLDHFLADKDYFGAGKIILSSASSKTAMGLGYLLSLRDNVTSIGLTSDRNVDFVKGLGWYEEVFAYDAVDELPREDVTYVDFAGNGDLRHTLHNLYLDHLKHDAVIGAAHWDQTGNRENLPGPRPEVFFAPAEAANRIQEWGGAGFQKRLAEVATAFTQSASKHLAVKTFDGLNALDEPYNALLDGSANPADGYIIEV